MKLICGLGNPGKQYLNTKHNFGFIVIDQLVKDYNFSYSSSNFYGDLYQGEICNQKIFLLKPTTFMNNSGVAVAKVKQFYKIEIVNIVVLHDDFDINFGKIKIKIGGGHGGHNGLKSIDSMIGKDYQRIRLGIKKEENNLKAIDYVLQNFTSEDSKIVNNISEKISHFIHHLIAGKIDSFYNKFYSQLN